ncbi:MAG: carbohydrate binding family 9 domain-containing protein [Acidobacteria bacterium]|nr:carbohydrate binding family 9 domain-containing protein [Acidobacteriota bacterium]
MIMIIRVVVWVLVATAAYAANIDYEAARLERRLQPTKTTEEIVIDGRMDESAWTQAPAATRFIQNEPLEDEPASEETVVRALYDQDNLYFGIYAHDSEPDRLISSELNKDFNRLAGDTIEIILDTFRDERNGYLFAINPAGAKWDGQITNEGRETNEDWDAIWLVKTRVVEDGWTAEVAIPFKSLKFRNDAVQKWGINFHRSVRRKNEDSFWSPLPRIYNVSRVSLAGTLEGVEGVRPGANLKVKPYVVSRLIEDSKGKRNYTGDLGLDVKYGLTSGLTWDLTYNTDFSQVEVDDQQINLTRFSLFFPEKREFFLENSGIFQFGPGTERGPNPSVVSGDNRFFFSRRIGLSDDPQPIPIPILGGTRLTGRAGPFELGFLNIQQREQGNSRATNFTVARLRRNIFTNSDIGVIFNNKELQDSAHFNRAVGVDANFRFGQATTIYSYIAKTFTPNGKGRDLAGRIAFHYVNNTYDLRHSYTSIQEGFDNEMGFAPRVGIRKFGGFAGRYDRPESLRGTMRSIFPHLGYSFIWDRDGNLESRDIDYHLQFYFQNGANAEPGFNTQREHLVRPFPINRRRNIVIPPGVYNFYELLAQGTSDRSRRFSGNFQTLFGPYYTGYKRTYTLGAIVRLNHQFNTSFTYTHNNIDLREGSFNTHLLGIAGAYSFSTSMFLNAFIQYNSDAQQWSSNIRFNLIHRPLSDIFLVYNERRDSAQGELIDRAIVAKITYMIAR